jgi:peptidoglycan/LPS O-acetylase OafA/YrhL
MLNPENKIYFPGLNGLRFIAAFLVIINHIEVAKLFCGYDNYMQYPFFTSIGSLSVTLFFVLSGFLITYLLLDEKENTRNINTGKFYLKRALRIWPVYFLTIILALTVFNSDIFHCKAMPEGMVTPGFILFLFILPNIAAIVFPSVFFLNHIWSIGIEEQFYLIWPWVIRFTKKYLKVFIIIIVSVIIIGASLRLMVNVSVTNSNVQLLKQIRACFSMYRISCMAIGGIGAWLLFYKKDKILKLIYRKDIQCVTFLVLIVFFVIGPDIKLIKHEFYSVLFCVLILNLASNPQPILTLENSVLNFLGKISYGIYMYHPFAIGISIAVLRKIDLFPENTFFFNFILYLLTFILTITVSAGSYYLMERRIMKLKKALPL